MKADNFAIAKALVKNKNKILLGKAVALVARNFLGIYFLKKGTVK